MCQPQLGFAQSAFLMRRGRPSPYFPAPVPSGYHAGSLPNSHGGAAAGGHHCVALGTHLPAQWPRWMAPQTPPACDTSTACPAAAPPPAPAAPPGCRAAPACKRQGKARKHRERCSESGCGVIRWRSCLQQVRRGRGIWGAACAIQHGCQHSAASRRAGLALDQHGGKQAQQELAAGKRAGRRKPNALLICFSSQAPSRPRVRPYQRHTCLYT
jgi:hypothetical protein